MSSNGTLNPGQTKTLTVSFTDANGTVHPLQSLPTCVDATGTLVTAEVSTTGQPPAVTDPTFAWTVAAPASVTTGQEFELAVSGTNPDGTVDASQYAIIIATPDDTVVDVISFE